MRRGTRVGQAYIAVTADGDGINEEIVDSVEEAGPGVEKAGEEHGDRYGVKFSDRFRKHLDKTMPRIAARLGKQVEEAGEGAGEVAGDKASRSFSKRMTDRLFDDDFADRIGERLGARIGGHMVDSLNHALSTDGFEGNALRDLFIRINTAAAEAEAEASGTTSGGSRGGSNDRFVGLIKSRNDALHVFGITLKITTGLVEGFGRAMASLPSLLVKIGNGFGEGGLNFSKGLSSFAAAGPAAVSALVAIALAMTVLVSVANALLAILTALASTILSALVGALAVGAAGFTALAAAGGLAVLAFMSMTNAQKDLMSEAFKPLHEVAIGLGQVIISDIVPAFEQWSYNMQVALAVAKPLADVLGGALAQAGSILTASFSGTGFQMFVAAMATLVGPILTNLSSALGGFLNGMMGTFAAILPFVAEFAEYLNRIATRFAAWASSAQGQNAIVDFVSRALDSFRSLWNFLGAVGGLISRVLFGAEGQYAGNTIFDSMAASVRRFTDYISQEDRLERWLAEGVTFAYALAETIVTIGKVLQRLNESGVIEGLASIASFGAQAYQWFSDLPRVLQNIIFPLQGIADLVGFIGSIIGDGGSGLPRSSAGSTAALGALLDPDGSMGINPNITPSASALPPLPNFQAMIEELMASGNTALGATYESAGGYLPDPTKGIKKDKPFKNPWLDYANSVLDSLPTVKMTMKKAIRELNRAVRNAISEAASAGTLAGVENALGAQMDALVSQGNQMVESAQSAVRSAAERLASASSMKEARKALKELKQVQKDLAEAMKIQERLNAAAGILEDQQVVSSSNVAALLSGIKVVNATLADYAAAREQLTIRIEEANQRLTEAIALRTNFASQVTTAATQFASILSASAKTINGVQQALTAGDIVDNLRNRLQKLRDFQNNLRILLAQGLSNAAYQQLVEAGVESGGAYAQALIEGGQGAVQQVNGLVGEIGSAAEEMGNETAARLYDAGVAAAEGLLEGLKSLEGELVTAAAALGQAIAQAIKDALNGTGATTGGGSGGGSGGGGNGGDPWPGGMHEFKNRGDGRCKVCGKVRNTSKHTNRDVETGGWNEGGWSSSSMVARTPVPAGVAAGGSQAGVSGNGQLFRDFVISTPTEDPKAVAVEAINELTGRL